MSRKNVLPQAHIVTAQAMATSFIQDPPTSVQYLDNIMLQIVFTGTPTGTFTVQGSNDYNLNEPDYTPTWVTLPLSGTPTASGSGDTIDIQLTQLASPWIRVAYTASSGTGVCDVWISAKAI